MNENLDLTELLKDCPKGIKLYSKSLGTVKFACIDNINNCILVNGYNDKIAVYKKNGVFLCAEADAEIDLLPSKDQRDWKKWHIPFKDGDIAVSKSGNLIGIVKISCSDDDCYGVYVVCDNWGEYPIIYDDTKIYFSRLATEEEKQLLFDAIKDNGYEWNAETKTLEKLIVPKFKVGDRIKHRLTGDIYKVVFILSNECSGGVYDVLTTNEIGKSIDIEEQDNYELVPNKFTPKFFKPFDKVLVRDYSGKTWIAAFFSHINDSNQFWYKFVTIGGTSYKQMIPYNDDTKHLLGTNNEAPEYYKCWED